MLAAIRDSCVRLLLRAVLTVTDGMFGRDKEDC